MSVSTSSTLLLVLALVLGGGIFVGPDRDRVEGPPMKKAEARADTVLANGSFEGKEGIATSGSYRIERENGNLQLVLGSDFQTEDGPDLHVVLSPTPSDKATGENVMEETTVTVGALDALEGEQTYDLQDDLALDPLESVAIHCIQFSHLYGVANLN